MPLLLGQEEGDLSSQTLTTPEQLTSMILNI